MATKITHLTDEQQAAMAGHAEKWIAIGQQTGEADWAAFEHGAEACYGYAGIPWHSNVVRVPNPFVLTLAAPIAGHLLDNGEIDHLDQAQPTKPGGAVDGAVYGAVDGAVGGAVYGAVDGAVGGAVYGAVDGAVGRAVYGAVDGAVGRAVDGAVDGAVGRAVYGAVGRAVYGAVDGAVGGAVGGAVYGAVYGAVGRAVDGAVYGAVDGAVDGAVGRAVYGAVYGAVGGAVYGAVGGADLQNAIRRGWTNRLSGQWYASWLARSSFFRDVCGLELDGDLWDRDRAYAQANTAGWWWPHRRFTMVSDRPRVLHLEQVGEPGWGSHRLHCATGPAIAWDGYALWFWHGQAVPQWVVEAPTAKLIAAEANVEVRRCGIEALGWDRFIADAGLRLVGAEPDPGNPGQQLELYDVPTELWGDPVRVVLAVNGSVERDGTRRRYGLTVPVDMSTPTNAVAWSYGLRRDQYALLQRRT